jgi:hypothetical protein
MGAAGTVEDLPGIIAEVFRGPPAEDSQPVLRRRCTVSLGRVGNIRYSDDGSPHRSMFLHTWLANPNPAS